MAQEIIATLDAQFHQQIIELEEKQLGRPERFVVELVTKVG